MILDVRKFIEAERPYWEELDAAIDALERTDARLTLGRARRVHYLYQRASSDLARLITFADEPETRAYLEGLVARAYGEIHESRAHHVGEALRGWFTVRFPQAFRRHFGAFVLSCALFLAGSAFGAGIITFDPEQKPQLIPPMFSHLAGDPSDRVADEEAGAPDVTAAQSAQFSTALMFNNIRVSIFALALGVTWGLGTVLVLFNNGVLLGAVGADYVIAGETVFLAGWLLPHGSVEIPAILIASQAGLVIAAALVGWRDRRGLRARLRSVTRDVVTLVFGVALLLVWAGIVEAFFSQFHEPLLPYPLKIAVGVIQLVALFTFLSYAARGKTPKDTAHA